MQYSTRAFGFRIASDMDLSGIACPPGSADISVEWRLSTANSSHLEECQWEDSIPGGETLALLPGFGSIRARRGERVVIETRPTPEAARLRSVVTGVALPLVLKQRDLLLLEASAVRWQGRVFLLVGRGPCGKSALAALFADAGAELLADSHCAIRLELGGRLVVAPGLPHVKLWPSQVSELSSDWPEPELLRAGIEKRLLIVPDRFAGEDCEIDGFFLLRRGIDSNFHIRRLLPKDALSGLAVASDRLSGAPTREQKILRFRAISAMAALPVCHLLQWRRDAARVTPTRDRLVEFLEGASSRVAL